MIIKEYKKFRGVVSFDFDGVLHTSMIPGTLHPINFILPDTWKPNLKLHDILRKEKKYFNRVAYDHFLIEAQ